MSLVATRHKKNVLPFPFYGLKKIENLELFEKELNSGTPHEKTWNLFIFLVPEPNFGALPSGKRHDRPRPKYLPTNNVESRSLPTHRTLSLSRRFPMRWHCSVTTVKSLRRFSTRRHPHCQGCCTAKLKEIADAPLCSLATVIEEVAAQSCNCSLATVKISRRLLTRCHCHCWGGHAANPKEIAYAPTLLSHHCCWGGFLIAVSLPSRIQGEQKIWEE